MIVMRKSVLLLAVAVTPVFLMAMRSSQDSDLIKRMEGLEHRLGEFQLRLEKIEKLVTWGRLGPSNEERAKLTIARLATLRTALAFYEIDNDYYPSTEQGLVALIEKPKKGREAKKWKKYLLDDDVPRDPWGNAYIYRFPGEKDPAEFDLFSMGPDGKPGTADDISFK